MEALTGIVIAVAVLYFWLLGHWFARVLAFLAIAPVLAGIVLLLVPASCWILAVWGAILAWPASGIPRYYWSRRITLVAPGDFAAADRAERLLRSW